jgi:DNA polymerase I-like protein with 3'-5' exonuclease and polymerase domains
MKSTDLHVNTASRMFNIPPNQVTRDQRTAAKAINFGHSAGAQLDPSG